MENLDDRFGLSGIANSAQAGAGEIVQWEIDSVNMNVNCSQTINISKLH